MEKMIDRFYVTTADGGKRELFVYQKYIDAGTFDDPYAKIPGLKRVVDAHGNAVNVLGNGEYEIVALSLKAKGKVL